MAFSNITAETENGALLWGGDGTPITGIELNGVRLHMIAPRSDLADSIGGNLDLRWTSTRPQDGIIASDIPAFFARKVDGLRLRDVQIDWAGSVPDYYSEGIRVEEFKNLEVDSFSGRQSPAAGAAIALKDGVGVSITNSRATPGTATFLQLDHVTDRRVFVNYDLSGAKTAIAPSDHRFYTQIVGLAARQKASGRPATEKEKTKH